MTLPRNKRFLFGEGRRRSSSEREVGSRIKGLANLTLTHNLIHNGQQALVRPLGVHQDLRKLPSRGMALDLNEFLSLRLWSLQRSNPWHPYAIPPYVNRTV